MAAVVGSEQRSAVGWYASDRRAVAQVAWSVVSRHWETGDCALAPVLYEYAQKGSGGYSYDADAEGADVSAPGPRYETDDRVGIWF